ncbi:hypothetical protein BGZ65_009390 [Modicella reniformis]|uniref:C2H2-type domain-containing protein n=1 Tax=Modicella reniformis TaxID=1440133 RepID=A0A9P6J4H7_9FUNG|nr:hypothetical protein BGZ65_009390 [Modicella reniformis]
MQANRTYVCSLNDCGETFTVLFDWTRHVRKHATMRQTAGDISGPPGPKVTAAQVSQIQSTMQHRQEAPTGQTPVGLPFLVSNPNLKWTSPKSGASFSPVSSPSFSTVAGPVSMPSLLSSDAKTPNGSRPANATATRDTKTKGQSSKNSRTTKALESSQKVRGKKSEVHSGHSEAPSQQKQPPVPTSTTSMGPPAAPVVSSETRSLSPFVASSTTQPIPARATPPATIQTQTQQVSQSLQELQLDQHESEKDTSINLAMPTTASTTSVLQPVGSAPSSPTPSALAHSRTNKRQPREQSDIEGINDHIDIESFDDNNGTSSLRDPKQVDEASDVRKTDEPSATLQGCALSIQASEWPTKQIKSRSKSKSKEHKPQLTHKCDTIFKSTTDEITHYLEHFVMAGPYIVCPIPTCRMVFVSQNQLEEHEGKYHDVPSTLPPPPNQKQAKQQSTGKETTRKETTGKEAAGKEPTEKEPTGKETTGKEPTGKEPTGKEPTGKEATRRETVMKVAMEKETTMKETPSPTGSSITAQRVTRSQSKTPTATTSSGPSTRKGDKEVEFADVPLKLLGPFKK